jgi:glycogen(starch) synthase
MAATSDSMHICLVSTFYYPRLRGGTEHSLQHLAESLAGKGVRVSVVSLHDGTKAERFEHNGVECHALPAAHLAKCLDRTVQHTAPIRALWHVLDVFNPSAGRLLAGTLAEIRPDIVQTHNLPGWSCAAWRAVRNDALPHIQVLHDYQLTCPPATRFRKGANCLGTCAGCMPFCAARRRLSGSVRHVVANSHYTRKLHLDLGFFRSASSFDVIYGAVPRQSQFAPGPSPDNRLKVGYLGRLHPSKGIELLVDSFTAAGRTDAKLLIAGRGTESYESELRRRAAGRAIDFVGQRNGSEFLSSIDVLVVPSLWNEPMGRVIIEAASHGVPVVAAARGGIPELVKVGRTGWLFDPSVPGQLDRIIRDLALDDIQRLGPACLSWAEEFGPEAISGQWISLYERILARSGPISPQFALRAQTTASGLPA